MSNANFVEFFDKTPPEAYDERNQKMAAISQNMHFLTKLVLQDLPANAKILCVGVGTGAEILALAKAFPGWTFQGLDPSANMLEGCRRSLDKEGLKDRCQLFHGYLSDFSSTEKYDAVLCFLVMHFIKDIKVRAETFAGMAQRLKPGGYLVSAEISFDVNSSQFPEFVKKWKNLHQLSGATPESLGQIPNQLREQLGVIAPEETERLIKQAGLAMPIQFFQSLMIRAWYARK